MVTHTSFIPRYAVILLFGVVGLGLLAPVARREARKASVWQDATCVIEDVAVNTWKDSDGDTRHSTTVTFSYVQRGERVTAKEDNPSAAGSHTEAETRLPKGKEVPCAYDPDEPGEATIDPGKVPWGLFLSCLIPLAWLVFGLMGMMAFRSRPGFDADALPVELPRRLDPATALAMPMGLTGFGLLFGAAWNGSMAWMLHGAPAALPCMALHLGAGGYLLWEQARPMLQRRKLGDTVVECSTQVLSLGETITVRVVQLGRGSINELSAEVICEEIARYTEGTTDKTDRHTALALPLDTLRGQRVRPDAPLVLRGSARIPKDAMPSFAGKHNEIAWSVRVKVDVADAPDRLDTYPLAVEARRAS